MAAVFLVGLLHALAPLRAQYSMTVEASNASQPGLTTYRFFVDMNDPTDRMSAVFADDESPMFIDVPDGAFNSTFNSSWNASGINPAFVAVMPELADDTYATIGLTGPASTSGLANAADPSVVEDSTQPITPFFLTNGATFVESSTLVGSSWYILNTAANGLPDADMRVMILQVTTSGSLSGQISYQVFPLGVGPNEQRYTVLFHGAGTYGESTVLGCTDEAAVNYCVLAVQDDGSCFYEYLGCTDQNACNFSQNASYDDGLQCEYPPDGFCDCEGSVLDECGVCGGSGIAEGACDCEGSVLDECGVCGGPGIAEGACDCEGNVLDECGVCGGSGIAEGACDCVGNVLDAVGNCGGACQSDANSNGICDEDEIQGSSCGWGTYWNADSASCVLTIPPYLGDWGDYNTLNPCYFDLDLTGTVGAGDLLNFLGTYGMSAGCDWNHSSE
ncbi:MAG: hypothetical protein O2791_04895 [Bacteroidetes bacterium]|nr:hypothetical protein [Bacteroidota bacterium]